jgi:hypothetical protein
MLPRLLLRPQPGERALVSRAFPSWTRSILTEIYLCHACSDHVSEGGHAGAGHLRRAGLQDSAAARGSAPLARGGGGESFIRVHWVAVPKALRARRVNRRRTRRRPTKGGWSLRTTSTARSGCR